MNYLILIKNIESENQKIIETVKHKQISEWNIKQSLDNSKRPRFVSKMLVQKGLMK